MSGARAHARFLRCGMRHEALGKAAQLRHQTQDPRRDQDFGATWHSGSAELGWRLGRLLEAAW